MSLLGIEAFSSTAASTRTRGHAPRWRRAGAGRGPHGDKRTHMQPLPRWWRRAASSRFPWRRPVCDGVVNYHRMRRSFEQRPRDLLPCGGEPERDKTRVAHDDSGAQGVRLPQAGTGLPRGGAAKGGAAESLLTREARPAHECGRGGACQQLATSGHQRRALC